MGVTWRDFVRIWAWVTALIVAVSASVLLVARFVFWFGDLVFGVGR
jgi:hypothetical protein